MKLLKGTVHKSTFILLSALISTFTRAQADVKVDINKGGGPSWYTSPWVWIVGAIIFIFLLVALLRGNGKEKIK